MSQPSEVSLALFLTLRRVAWVQVRWPSLGPAPADLLKYSSYASRCENLLAEPSLHNLLLRPDWNKSIS
jgi:hypothetical protein